MENWQFLIQEQSDRSWRPLESPIVEIIEGKYRVVARTKRTNMDVDVRVTHSSTLEVPPKRRIQKRSRRTNTEGLIAVIPFTYLKPGIWELQCSGDLMSDLLGKSWQYSVYLQVLPTLSLGKDEGDEGDEGATSTSSALQNIDHPVSPVWLKAQTAEQILSNLIELALPPSEPLLDDETTVEDSSVTILDLPLLLTLEEETYVAHWGQTLTINGLVESKQTNQVLDETSNLERFCAGELRIELSSPHGSERLTQVRQPLPEKLLPFTIKCSIEIPNHWESKLILADISLYGVLAGTGVTRLLAHQSFTITADVTELLAISAAVNKSELDILYSLQGQPASPIASKEPTPSVPLKLELFNIVKTVKTIQPLQLKPSPKKSLPPQIAPRNLHKTVASLQLPKLPPHQTKTMSVKSVSTSTQLHRLENNGTIVAINRVTSMGTTFPYLRRIQALPSCQEEALNQSMSFDSHDWDETEAHDEDAHKLVVNDAQFHQDSFAEVIVPPSSESITVGHPNPYSSPLIQKWMHSQGYYSSEPIKVQDQDDENNFIPSHEMLSEEQVQPLTTDLATDEITVVADLATDEITVVADELSVRTIDQVSPSSSPLPITPYPQRGPRVPHSRQLAREIVVDDTYSQAEADAFKNYPSKQEEQSVSDLPTITEPLAIPQLHLPEGELISGKSVRVIVQVPKEHPQVAVKLWVEDCQTRWLLDGPRLLTNLLPNSLGGLEVMTYINVPFGCLEIHLEAIAIDMATQQESHKITVQRTVIPPDLPNVPLDEVLLRI